MSFEYRCRQRGRLEGAAVGAALTALVALLVPAALAQVPAGQAVAAEPVIVGDGPQADACGSVGLVSGLDPKASNALSVRSGPGVQHRRVDLVATGQMLWICGRQDRWYAVVYSKTGGGCGVSTPIDPPRAYAGACRQGWVYDAYVTLVAG